MTAENAPQGPEPARGEFDDLPPALALRTENPRLDDELDAWKQRRTERLTQAAAW